jgi:hypothetical protein
MEKKTDYKNAIIFSAIIYKILAIFTDLSRMKIKISSNNQLCSSDAAYQIEVCDKTQQTFKNSVCGM